MRLKRNFLISVALMFSATAYAQFGGLLNQLKETVNQEGNTNSVPAAEIDKKKAMTGDEFCSKLKSSSELKEFASYAKRFATQHNSSYAFDTSDKIVGNWIASKLVPMLDVSQNKNANDVIQNFIRPSEDAVNECALTIRDSDLLYLMASDQRSYDDLKSKLDKFVETQAPQSVRKIDASGDISTETVAAKKQSISAIESSVQTSLMNRNGIPSAWLVSWLLLLDENEQTLKNVYPEIKRLTLETLAEKDLKKQESDARWEKEQKERQERESETNDGLGRAFFGAPLLTLLLLFGASIFVRKGVPKSDGNKFVRNLGNALWLAAMTLVMAGFAVYSIVLAVFFIPLALIFAWAFAIEEAGVAFDSKKNTIQIPATGAEADSILDYFKLSYLFRFMKRVEIPTESIRSISGWVDATATTSYNKQTNSVNTNVSYTHRLNITSTMGQWTVSFKSRQKRDAAHTLIAEVANLE